MLFPSTRLKVLIYCMTSHFLLNGATQTRCHEHERNSNNNKMQTNPTALHYVGALDLSRVGQSLVLAGQAQPQTTQPPAPIPEFEAPIGNQTVAMGRDAQLSCKIRDLGAYRTAWLRVEDKGILTIHNNIITRNYRFGLINNDDGREFTLTIKNIQPSDRGGYMCQINSVPMKYAIGYLDVLTPPVFDPTDGGGGPAQEQAGGEDSSLAMQAASLVTLTEGANATLTCQASGHPPPEITWRREDGQPILLEGAAGAAGQEGQTGVEGPTLSLGPVHRLHSGAYLCIASNGVQPSASRRQVLNVQFPPAIRITQTDLGAVLQEPEINLNCYVELNPTGDYHWVKIPPNTTTPAAAASDDSSLIEHDELQNSDKFEIVMNQVGSDKVHMSLNIRQVERGDFATYKCIARNALGIQSSAIRVYESPGYNRGGGNGHGSSSGNNNNNGNSILDDKEFMDKQQNDQASGRPSATKQSMFSRAHTRSSWIQRTSQGTKSDFTSSSCHQSLFRNLLPRNKFTRQQSTLELLQSLLFLLTHQSIISLLFAGFATLAMFQYTHNVPHQEITHR